MATYEELKTLDMHGVLLNRCEVAVWVAINTIATENPSTANHAARVAWAKDAVARPRVVAEAVIKIALAANAGATTAQILNATDAALQAVVNSAVAMLAGIAT